MEHSAANYQKVTKLIETFRLVCRGHSLKFFIASAFSSEFHRNTYQSIALETLYDLLFEFISIGRTVRPQIVRNGEGIREDALSRGWIS